MGLKLVVENIELGQLTINLYFPLTVCLLGLIFRCEDFIILFPFLGYIIVGVVSVIFSPRHVSQESFLIFSVVAPGFL